MAYLSNYGIIAAKSIKITFMTVVLILVIALGFLRSSSFRLASSQLDPSYLPHRELNQAISHSFLPVYNSTHLWSMHFADENYFRLASLLPCQIVEYSGGSKIDTVDSCDHSSTNEYSMENTLRAQKWLYEHQHPINCTDRKFAIIQNFAWSGFGSTIHQIAWAIGMAIAENRIAVYATPGHWVSDLFVRNQSSL